MDRLRLGRVKAHDGSPPARKGGWRMITWVGLVLLLCGLAMSWAFVSANIRPHPSVVAPADPPARDLTIASSDGITLSATYWPAPRGAPAVLMLHGLGSSRGGRVANARWLSERGYAVLTVDFRGHGGSTPAPSSFGVGESRDALAAFRWLKQETGNAPVAVIGISLGGTASLVGQDGPLPAEALVLQGVYADIRHGLRNRIASLTGMPIATLLEPLLSFQSRPRFGVWPDEIAPIKAIARYRNPVLVMGGEADIFTPPGETLALAAAAGGPHWHWIAPGADHGGISGIASERYRAVLLPFLERTIGRPAPPSE